MSEAQTGGQRGTNTIYHILTMKELIKLGKKKVYMVYLDITKAYMGTCHNVCNVHVRTPKQDMSNCQKLKWKPDSKSKHTKNGLTRLIDIKDSIR